MPVSRCLSQFVITGAALALATILCAPDVNRPAAVSTQLVIHSYRPRGRQARAIKHSLRTRGPVDQKGLSRDAFTSWSIKWRWPENSGNSIVPDTIQVSLKAEIVLPRLPWKVERENPAWRQYHQALVSHELNHFHFAVAGSEELVRRYAESGRKGVLSTAEAHSIARDIVRQVRKNDKQYDLLTDHGRTEGVRWVSSRHRVDSSIN